MNDVEIGTYDNKLGLTAFSHNIEIINNTIRKILFVDNITEEFH